MKHGVAKIHCTPLQVPRVSVQFGGNMYKLAFVFSTVPIWLPIILACLPLILSYYIAYYMFCVKPPQILCMKTEKNKRIIEKCRILHINYWPSFFALNGHFQTLLVPLMGKVKVASDKHSVEVIDGGNCVFSLAKCQNFTETTPIVLIYHGVAGNR